MTEGSFPPNTSALFQTYDLSPQECLFIDDLERNVAAAKTLGMQGIVFDGSAEHLRETLKNMDIDI